MCGIVGVVASSDGKRLVREQAQDAASNSEGLGLALAQKLLPLARDILGATVNGI